MTLMWRCWALGALVFWAMSCHAEPPIEVVQNFESGAMDVGPDTRADNDAHGVDPDTGVIDVSGGDSQPKSRYAFIDEVALAELKNIRRDPRPESLTQGHHYVTSDEYAHYLFRDALDDLGGVYVGLGTDQNYFLAGWSKPDVMVLLDFDQYVVDLHAIYAIIFKRADTPEAFLATWGSEAEAEVVEAINATYPDKKRQQKLIKIYTRHRRRILRRLKFTQQTCRVQGVATFLDDVDQYEHVAGLWREGRAFAVRGDLTADKAIADLGAWAHKHKQEIRTLYLSNAEYYFPFETGAYVKNITGLPMNEETVVVHTYPRSKKFYKYVYEFGPTYQRWLKSGKAANMRELIRKSTRRVEPQLYFMAKHPDRSEPHQEAFSRAESRAAEREKSLEDPNLATVRITAKPNGFLVLDNHRVGVVTPGKIRLAPGTHKLRVKFETGVLSDEQEITLRKGQRTSLEFEPPVAKPEAAQP